MNTKTLYKFLREDLKSQNGDCTWKIGEWKKEPKVSLCDYGFHASKTPLQAMGYVAGEIVAEVEVRGEHKEDDDKEVWSEMRIVKAWKWEKKDSVALSIFAAELCIDNYEKVYPNDKRPREAIEAAKAFLLDPSEKNRLAAESAARSAASAAWLAESAARLAARSAARSALSAAWLAASAARLAAARLAESAARLAAESAASAAWLAAWLARSSAARLARSSAARLARSLAARSAARLAESAAKKKLIASLDKWFLERITILTEIK